MENKISSEFFDFINTTSYNEPQIIKIINSLSFSADLKIMLSDFLKFTHKIGTTTLKIGRKIIDFAINLLQSFPNLGFALIMSIILSALVSMIPVLGTILGPMAATIITAFGIYKGTEMEMKTGDFEIRIRSFINNFRELNT